MVPHLLSEPSAVGPAAMLGGVGPISATTVGPTRPASPLDDVARIPDKPDRHYVAERAAANSVRALAELEPTVLASGHGRRMAVPKRRLPSERSRSFSASDNALRRRWHPDQTFRYAEISAPLGTIPLKRGIFDV
jgi:hypothetical protein